MMRNNKTKTKAPRVYAIVPYRIHIGMVLLLFLCGACKKHGEGPYAKEYIYQGISWESSDRVFTNGQEITDPEIKKNYLAQSQSFFSGVKTVVENFNLRIAFLSDTTVLFHSPDQFSFEKMGNKYLFSSKEYYLDGSLSHDVVVFEKIWKYSPTYRLMNQYGYYTTYMYVGYEEGRRFTMPYLAYRYSRDDKFRGRAVSTGMGFNEFNEDFIKELKASDTLAIRQCELHFIAKVANEK